MASRYIVERFYVRHKGKIYTQGELLPVEFTEKDKFRNLYSRRLKLVEIPDGPFGLPIIGETPENIELPEVEEVKAAASSKKQSGIASTTPPGTPMAKIPVKK